MSSSRFGFLRAMALQTANEFKEAYMEHKPCDTCKDYKRPGFIWTSNKQWVPCWVCNRGLKLGQELGNASEAPPVVKPPIVLVAADFTTVSNERRPQMHGAKWMSPSELHAASELNSKIGNVTVINGKAKAVVDLFSYVNTVEYPNHQQKRVKLYICVKCKMRYTYKPVQFGDVCTEYGCTGKVVENKEVHVRAIPHGKPEQILHFIHMVQAVDKDWIKPKVCNVCNGFIIPTPVMDAEKMHKLAKQCGLKKLKFKRWLEGCHGEAVNS